MAVNSAKKTSYYINRGATLLLFAAVAGMMSFAAAASFEDHQDIVMVVDEPQSSYAGGVQHERFQLPDGKSLTFSRKRKPGNLGCAGTGEECGLTTWCCGSLTCSSTAWGGTCYQVDHCEGAGGFCSLNYPFTCCYPLTCDYPHGCR